MDDVVNPVPAVADAGLTTEAEAVRLVVWDLDETFWRGTLTEGGITEYVEAHHDIVKALADRGIMSSICSKNDFNTVAEILREKGIFDYFIFPSVSWEPKGMRLARLIETVGLRPPTVMFIDDNPNNLAEARAVVPGIQVENEHFIARMLDDRRFKGKDDRGHSRLKQYKTLETRKRDEDAAVQAGSNHDFLRGCDIRVYLEYDIATHVDRAIELINRTNQLNFTKKRLPEDLETARQELLRECTRGATKACLVRVIDKYGDYGFVGFVMLRNGRAQLIPGRAHKRLIHYCWSCRTLGMLVEHWFYNYLRQPELTVVGEVLTDLSVERDIDWVRVVASLDHVTVARQIVAPEMRLLGGCEANAIGVYLGGYSEKVRVTGNFAAGGLFVRVNSVSLVLSMLKQTGPEREADLKALGLSSEALGAHYLDDVSPGTLFVFSGAFDGKPLGQIRYRHKTGGWEIKVEAMAYEALLLKSVEQGLAQLENGNAQEKDLAKIIRRVHAHYDIVPAPMGTELEALMVEFVDKIPSGSKLIFTLDGDRVRNRNGQIEIYPKVAEYNAFVHQFSERYPFVGVMGYGDCVTNDSEILTGRGNHYERTVYWRAAEKIAAIARDLTAKP